MPGVPITPGFIRPDPHPGPDLPTITKSATGLLNDGQPSRYSILTDYLKGFVAQGLVRDVDDLIRNYTHLIGEIFFQWISENHEAAVVIFPDVNGAEEIVALVNLYAAIHPVDGTGPMTGLIKIPPEFSN